MTSIGEVSNFELEGSYGHYPPDLLYLIDKMWLVIEVDFKSSMIHGEEQLRITTKSALNKIELDCGELDIKSIYITSADFTSYQSPENELTHELKNKKLTIFLKDDVQENSKFHLLINYSAKPTRGFIFVKSDDGKTDQAWTQGQPVESKYWFPCLDHPQLKYSKEISVIVPKDNMLISNGELNIISQYVNENKTRFTWEETNPDSSYLTCIVIGKFVEISQGENYNGRIPLRYYVPKDKEEYSYKTFKDTSKIIEVFEEYFSTPFPYGKYSQIVVEKFPYGGMENSTCTTLYTDVLFDEKDNMDYDANDVISHELAHHWFGDLITCKDWQHIWLNEGFATFCEALYIQRTRTLDEYQYYIINMLDDYIDESSLYKRPIVTNVYRDEDDLFDYHSYKKGGLILHMLRSYMKEDDFQTSLKIYLDNYKHKTVETDNFRQICENVSGKSLQKFFKQWIFTKGHPILSITIERKDSNDIEIKVIQEQENLFDFLLELNFIFVTVDDKIERKIENVDITEKETFQKFNLKNFNLPEGSRLLYISIDPEYKILKDINLLKMPIDMLIRQIESEKSVFSKVQAIRALKDYQPSKEIITILKKVIKESFWGIGNEAAKILGSWDTEKQTIHDAIQECLDEISNPKLRKSLVISIGNFPVQSTYFILKNIIQNENESYRVRSEAANNIGQFSESLDLLKNIIENDSYFKKIVTQGALFGLIRIAIATNNNHLRNELIQLIISNTDSQMYNGIREMATVCLGFLGHYRIELRPIIFQCLKELLNDDWVHVRLLACIALGNAFESTQDDNVISELTKLKNNDIDGKVVRYAINAIKQIESKVEQEALKVDLKGVMKEDIDSRYKLFQIFGKSIIKK